MEEISEHVRRPKKTTVLAFGEGEDEKIFLRRLVAHYCRRDKVTVATGYAGGGSPSYIFSRALLYRNGEKRDFEFVLLDTDKAWPDEMIAQAQLMEIELIGSDPCLESFFLEILESEEKCTGLGSRRCKEIFEKNFSRGNFTEEECERLFTKAVLNEARLRIPVLDKLIRRIEGTA